MSRYRPLVVGFLVLTASSPAWAQAELCRIVANRLWSQVAVNPLREDTPLAELSEVRAVRQDQTALPKAGQSIADALIADHAADPQLARKLHDQPPSGATRFGDTDLWLLDRVEGTLGCHTPLIVSVPPVDPAPASPAREIDLPGNPDPTALCALSALAAVTIEKIPALWIEQSGAFSNDAAQSTISIAAVHDQTFEQPCEVTLAYRITDQATHAFCDGIDCVPLVRTAEVLARRLRQEETADSLAAGVIRDDADGADYRRMAELAAAETQPTEWPAFGVALDTPYTTFADLVTFPLRLSDGHVYLARMGHGGFGWRQSPDTLLAIYRLRDGHMVPAASVYVAARRTGLSEIGVR